MVVPLFEQPDGAIHPVQNPKQCQSKCRGRFGCNAWTWTSQSRAENPETCYLKTWSRDTGRLRRAQHMVSGTVDCSKF